MALVNKNGFNNFQPSIKHGPFYSRDYDSDGSLWLPASGGAGGIFTFVGTFTNTRTAQGDYLLALTAAANSPFVVVDLSQIFDKLGTDPIFTAVFPNNGTNAPTAGGTAAASGVGPIKVSDDFEGHIIRGVMLTGYDVVFSIATAGLTTHTGTVVETTYDAAHTAGQVVVKDAAQALGVATNANVQIGAINLVTPFVIGSNASVKGTTEIADYLEIAIVNPGTSVYKLYGVRLYFDYCLN